MRRELPLLEAIILERFLLLVDVTEARRGVCCRKAELIQGDTDALLLAHVGRVDRVAPLTVARAHHLMLSVGLRITSLHTLQLELAH